MKLFIPRQGEFRRRGFSLIEVILAVGILAMSIVAIIAFVGATTQATSDVMSGAVASRLADNLRAELENEDLDQLYTYLDRPNPVELYATKDGELVVLESQFGGPPDTNDEEDDPPGILEGNRFFLLEVRLQENQLLDFDTALMGDSAMLPVSVHVVWPYKLRVSPDPSEAKDGQPENQSRLIFNTVILRKE